jgi:hypothetical protein
MCNLQGATIMTTPSMIRIHLVVMAGLVGVIVALIAGMLARSGGASVSVAVTYGGIGFAGKVSLALLVGSSVGLL